MVKAHLSSSSLPICQDDLFIMEETTNSWLQAHCYTEYGLPDDSLIVALSSCTCTTKCDIYDGVQSTISFLIPCHFSHRDSTLRFTSIFPAFAAQDCRHLGVQSWVRFCQQEFGEFPRLAGRYCIL